MAASQIFQLESAMDQVLKRGNVQVLEDFFERFTDQETLTHCSLHFVEKLDDFVCKSLDQNGARAASLGFASLHKLGKHLKLPDGQGLSELINKGLIKKMVQWLDKCKQLWILRGPHWDEALFNLCENFLNALMVVHESSKEGTNKITEYFLYPVGQLAVDPRIYILIQKEAIRKYNLILDKIPMELKKRRKILTSQEASDFMTKLAGRIMEGGDYDLQSSLMEALCRMATPAQRKKLADQWFSLGHVATAFTQIRDSEFETACRTFLNMVNGMQGEKRRVCSFPCLEVYLGKCELLMPSDEKLEEFWIDFNLDSRSITFYCSLPEEKEGHWETICISENEVESYSVTEEKKRQVLKIKLSEVVVVGEVEGSGLTISFSSALDIQQAARNVFGKIQNKHTSVSKTAIEMSSTQIVPESQVSLSGSEKTVAAPTSRFPAGNLQMVTPSRMKMSESTGFVRTSGSGKVKHDYFAAFKSCDKDKDRSSVHRVSLCDTTVRISTNTGGIKRQKTSEAEAAEMFLPDQNGDKSQEHEIVPDTQHRSGSKISSNWSKLSISEIITMPTQKVCSLSHQDSRSHSVGPQHSSSSGQKMSVSHPDLVVQKQFHSELTLRLQQVQCERNTDPPLQHPAVLPNIRGRSQDRRSGKLDAFPSLAPKVEQTKRKKNTEEECKGNLSVEAVAAEVKCSTARTAQKREKVKENTKTTLSSHEKRNADVAGNMVKFISSHYGKNTQTTENPVHSGDSPTQKSIPPVINSRPNFNMSWLSKDKGKISAAPSFAKSNKKSATNSIRQRKDVFEFSLDSPLSVGRKNKTQTDISAISSSSSAVVSTTKKARPETKNKPKSKKHLFSDTDVETTRTEVSWLAQSAMKPKKRVNQYQRQAARKPRENSRLPGQKSPDMFPPTLSSVKVNNKPKKKSSGLKEAVGQPMEAKMVKSTATSGKPQTRGKRPKRGAASTAKSYREPDSDDSLSEPQNAPVAKKYTVVQKEKNRESTSEEPHPKKRATIFADQPEHSDKREASTGSSSSSRQSDFRKQPALKLSTNDDLQIPSGSNKKTVIPAHKQRKAFKDSVPSENSSPSSVERMRSAEGSASTVNLPCSAVLSPQGSPVPVSPMPACQGAPSSVPLLRKPCATVSSKGKGKTSLHSSGKNFSSSKLQFMRSEPTPCSLEPEVAASRPLKGPSTEKKHLPLKPQPTFDLSTQPLLTSTLLQPKNPPVTSTPQSPYPEDSPGLGCQLDPRKASTESLDSLSQSSAKSVVLSSRSFKDSPNVPVMVSLQREQTPLAARDLDASQPLLSGPSRKRCSSISSNSDEEQKNSFGKEVTKKSKIRLQHSPRIKPRKLFKSFTEVSSSEKMSLAVSRSHMSFTHCGSDATDGDVDVDESLGCPDISVNQSNLYQHLSSELKNKLQNRCKVLEIYGRESSKSVKQHISSIDVQLNKHRTQRLEHVQKVLLEEIHSMEEEENTLTNMETDLAIFWKKQTGTFKKYQKQEVRRNETLRRVLQMNTSPSLKYEAEIFTSEMCLIKKDMKSVQDRLLNEMLEGEIQSVKRGLHALFFQ
ncbi:synaptonemal complex protein 2 isoform X2 [Oryzias latipes]|uniref:synaptonemal complex protein 2 isoform X2 n=1 Tax=Oryzias latipes TaxID=8090 RepID=UPI0009DAE6C3|nr:synaptonemal complex protein 2 isoform X2 [Oryzias latipes]